MSKEKLPKAWKLKRLGDVCTKPQYGWTSKAIPVGNVRYIRTTDLTKGKINWETVPFCELEPENIEKYQVMKDDILISRAGSVGFSFRVEDVPSNTIFASYLIRFKPNKVSSKYIEYFLKSPMYWKSISEVSAGIAIQNINASKLSDLEIPVAPLSEQQRIVARLDAIFGHLDVLREKLNRIPELLKNFRQQVLTQAVTGELTKEWREGKDLGEWEFVELQKVAKVVDPHPSHRTPPIHSGGVPYISIKDVDLNGEIDFENARLVSPEVLKEHKNRYDLRQGDFGFGKIGTLGKPFLLPIFEERKYTLSANIILIQPRSEGSPKFLFFYLNSPIINRLLKEGAKATSQPAFGIKKARIFPTPNPSPDEQQEIVKRVEALFGLADKIESQYQSLKANIDQLPQAVLAKAFRGELIDTNE